jgi:hypothetical protein
MFRHSCVIIREFYICALLSHVNAILTASILGGYVTWQGTDVKLPDDDIEMSKHVVVYKEILL